MNNELIEKYELELSTDSAVLKDSMKKLLTASFTLASEYQETADSIGKSKVDDSALNKIKQESIVEMDDDTRQDHIDEVANFRNYVIDAVKKDRNSIFFIKHLTNEIVELINSIDELVTKEVIPSQKSEERDAKVTKAFGLYEEYEQVSTMLENFSNMYVSFGNNLNDLEDELKVWSKEASEETEVEFDFGVKQLKDGSYKFKMPKPHSPTSRFGEAKKDTDVVTLTILIDKVDDEVTNMTLSEYAVLYEMPLTQKFVSDKTILNRLDLRKNEDTFEFTDKDDKKHTVHWTKSAI